MAHQPLERSLPILVRPSDGQDSQSSMGVNVSEHSMGSDSVLRLPPSRSSSLREPPMYNTGCQSPPATPPLDPGPETENPLIGGIGCHFPATLPSRAAFLTMESESATDSPTTPRAEPEGLDPDDLSAIEADLDTPRADAYSFETPIWPARLGESIFGAVLPLTPGLTPMRKRAASPPFAPRPAKRLKMHTQSAYESSRDEAYPDEDSHGLASGPAFRIAEQLTIDLMEATGFPVDNGSPEDDIFRQVETLRHTGPCSPCDDNSPVSETARTERRATQRRYAVDIESFTEDEIEEHLAGLLSAYRAFYLEPDGAEPPQPRDPEKARASRRIFRAIFDPQLGSAGDEEFLWQEEEEDVLDTFMAWTREKRIPSGLHRETFEDLSECLEHVGNLANAPFVKHIL
ncbi:hypothetical protein C8A01DRAFT_42861 [Parachaetomium inaequale]|uniref:Uncharacterized protein n=1 Tax=Parachaetomium inaequale TaxID=2588326 RepID=A0AAN6SW97_9PEZI|nr:hypothetical protein C8A01DRAFT_42861 [Parachaetomium inaequale]